VVEKMKAENIALRMYVYLACMIIMVPVIVLISASFTRSKYISFPPDLFSFRWWVEFLSSDIYQRSTLLSIQISAVSSVITTLVALLSARVLVVHSFRGKTFLSTLFNMPFTVPQVVYALAALFFFTSMGPILPIHFIICFVVIDLPFSVRAISANMSGLDPDLERAALVLGATPLLAFYKVTLPLIKPGLIGSFLFAFLSSFNNTTIAVFLSNPRYVTLPVAIFQEIEFYAYPSLVAAASFATILSLGMMATIHKFVGIASIYR
jgi:ABC-type spermidine/putrescine transport system permease subunit II